MKTDFCLKLGESFVTAKYKFTFHRILSFGIHGEMTTEQKMNRYKELGVQTAICVTAMETSNRILRHTFLRIGECLNIDDDNFCFRGFRLDDVQETEITFIFEYCKKGS